MFRHARKCGARVFDGVKVNEVHFAPLSPNSDVSSSNASINDCRRPVSASWCFEREATSGTLEFEYIVDASGRAGVLNRYYKGRRYNKELDNVASWGYWCHAGAYAPGTERAGSPYFEALKGEWPLFRDFTCLDM